MKKTIIFILTIISSLSLCGCGQQKKYSNFEHYDLKDNEKIVYTVSENYENYKYAVAMISPEDALIHEFGLFFEISKDDYILLDRMQTSNELKHSYKFFGNQLFTINNGSTSGLFMYTLNKDTFEKKELKFVDVGVPSEILDIDEHDIYYSTTQGIGYYKVKCSFESLECTKLGD